MGLAASQARLLTITSRKSDAQYESMRLSHQKLALSRNLQDISNEYQRSLNQTKLYYDYYGVGATDTQLTYSVLMHPSTMNNYIPIMLTNAQNQVVLSAPLAAAARRAGIPQEGLGCCTSEVIRTIFCEALAEEGVINNVQLDQIRRVPYNQYMGVGDNNLVTVVEDVQSYSALTDYLSNVSLNPALIGGGVGAILSVENQLNIGTYQYASDKVISVGGVDNWYQDPQYGTGGGYNNELINCASISLMDLINGNAGVLENRQVILLQNDGDDSQDLNSLNKKNISNDKYDNMVNSVIAVINSLASAIEAYAGNDTSIACAIDAANSAINSKFWNNSNNADVAMYTDSPNNYWIDGYGFLHTEVNDFKLADDVKDWVYSNGHNVLGPASTTSPGNIINDDSSHDDEEQFTDWLLPPDYSDTAYLAANETDYQGGEPTAYTASFASRTDGGTTPNLTYHSMNFATQFADEALALVNVYNSHKDPQDNYGSVNVGAISLTNFVQAWYSEFLAELASQNGNDAIAQTLHDSVVTRGKWVNPINNEALTNELNNYSFLTNVVEVNSNAARDASFYDALLNQICLQGWVENDQVAQDAKYLQEMLKSGRMFMYQMQDDNFYYQNNYSTNQLIKELDDEAAIAQAEARYSTEKARINAKEEELDMKMKNLDTEISALEQEYEAVKKMISNNAQKSFSRYQS